ncbi:MAG TPA: hypothetical protein PLX97_06245 [Gemmatales bacterium]|nr:hypothetical protein [Gemmatales bacterium]
MSEPVTLDSLAQRVTLLEAALLKQKQGRPKDWRRTVGMFADSEFMRQVDEEGRKIREADREAARQTGDQ